ncbi:MAG: 50S ribosome-binding GTPase, partial [Proteobacteria bacterium]|nr:50S ribosome-binding GTPase [Pseudomonadota bacterium]
MVKNLIATEDNLEVTVRNIDASEVVQRRLESLGIRPGIKLRKVSDAGTIVVAIGSSQVGIGRGMAEHITVEAEKFRALLFGNPNVGKSVVFSRLTGLDVISANYAGTTVAYTKGTLIVDGRMVELIDVPGAYTLEPTCTAEQVAKEFYDAGDAQLMINVVDATNLERNLYLTLQLLEKGIPLIVVLNKWDSARHKGIRIDVEELARRLQVPVITLVAITGEGLKELRGVIAKAMRGELVPPEFAAIDHQERWHIIGHISQEAQQIVHKHRSFVEKLEYASVRPVSGLVIAAAVLALSFFLIRTLGESLISYMFDPFFKNLYGPAVRSLVQSLVPVPVVQHLLLGRSPEFMESFGVLTTGIYIPLAIVLPYIFSFYLVLGVWEDTGYLPRLAVMLDRIMHHIGLHGHAVIPLVLSCGCKVP